MSKNYNSFSCIGRLTKDVEIKEVGEYKIGVFSVAVNGRKDDDVLFMECKAWSKTAEILSQYTKKGSKIFLTGELNLEKWEKDGTKHQRIVCNVTSFEFLDSKPAVDKVKDNFENPFDDSDLPPF